MSSYLRALIIVDSLFVKRKPCHRHVEKEDSAEASNWQRRLLIDPEDLPNHELLDSASNRSRNTDDKACLLSNLLIGKS